MSNLSENLNTYFFWIQSLSLKNLPIKAAGLRQLQCLQRTDLSYATKKKLAEFFSVGNNLPKWLKNCPRNINFS